MRVLVFHGYLLHGTGSNIYNASLAAALTELGHEVHLLCQDRRAEELPFVDAVGVWDSGRLTVRVVREPVRCTVYTPDIGRLLPVYVADQYEGFDARLFPELDDAELDHYIEANLAAVRDVAAAARPQAALANHAVMGPVILARALGDEVPFAVKIHGSAISYTVRPHPQRFLPYAREGLAAARGVLVGSRHSAEALFELIDDRALVEKTRLGPPGVDTRLFCPRPEGPAGAGLRALADRLEHGARRWGGHADGAAALRAIDPATERIVSYVGKLIVSKGVDLLLAAWPLVVAGAPDARLCIVGFGTYRDGLERLCAALSAGALDDARAIAAAGRGLEGGSPGRLEYLASFLERLSGERRDDYVASASRAFERVHFVGALDHADLPELLSACDAQVVPSTFPESFGMVAIEAAACGALPLSAAHSGLAEITRTLARALPEARRPLLSFRLGAGAIEEIAAKLSEWLSLDVGQRRQSALALAALAHGRYGWDRVAAGVVAAACGRLEELPAPRAP